ncbi:MAG: hypothetical protein V7695_10775 [Sulfitobacter sp.]
MAAHNRDDDEVWIVYAFGEFVALLDSERDAESMCSMLGSGHTWKHFIANRGR